MSDWTATKGSGPWPSPGTQWRAQQGTGPWPFIASPEKPCYNEGDRIHCKPPDDTAVWTPASSSIVPVTPSHIPCGYWYHNLHGILPAGGPVWSVGLNEYGECGCPNNQAGYYYPDFSAPGNASCYWTFRNLNAVPNSGAVSAWRSASGAPHCCILKLDGTLWGTGLNNYGQLGQGSGALGNYMAFQQMGTDSNWIEVSCGGMHTAALRADHTLWTCGYNTDGALGLGDTAHRNVLTQVPGGAAWKSVSCGSGHTLALKLDGTVWATGRNAQGQLGIGTISFPYPSSFVQVGSQSNWAMVTAGGLQSFGIQTDGTLWGWGYNLDGELGLNDLTNRTNPVATGNGQAYWAQVSAGGNHTVAVDQGGGVWATGWNNYGQLGLGDTVDRKVFTRVPGVPAFRELVAMSDSTMVIGSDYSLWGTGHESYGEMGFGPETGAFDQHRGQRLSFTRVGTDNDWLHLPHQSGNGGLTTIAIRMPH